MAKEFDTKKMDKLVTVLKGKDGFGQSETFYCEKTGIERSQIGRYLYVAELKADPSLKIAATGKAIVKAREQGTRWPRIAVRCGLSESKAKELWEEETGQSASTSYTGRGRKWDPNAVSVKSGTSGRRTGGAKSKAKTKATSGRRGKAGSAASKKTAASPGRRPGRRTTRAAAASDPK